MNEENSINVNIILEGYNGCISKFFIKCGDNIGGFSYGRKDEPNKCSGFLTVVINNAETHP